MSSTPQGTPQNTPPTTPRGATTTTPTTTALLQAATARANVIIAQSAQRVQTRQTVMATREIFTDGETVLATKRSEADIAQLGVTVDKKDREKLKTKDAKTYQKIQERCEKGIKTKLDHFDAASIADISSETSFSGVQTLLKELRRNIVDSQMSDIFTLVPVKMEKNTTSNEWEPTAADGISNLFENYASISIDLLRRFSKWIKEYGPNFMAVNLRWSEKTILNSCTERLKIKVNEQLDKIPTDERGGLVAYKIMITYVLSTSNEALRSLIAKLGNLKLTDFDGENVIQACTFIENMSIMLRDNDMTPKDFDESVHKVFKYSTCPDFVKLVEHIASNMRFGIKEYETTEYLTILEEEYSTKISAGTWPAKSTKTGKNASFGAFKEGGKDMSKITCLNCGELGHMVKDCPKPIDRKAIAENKKKIFRNNDTRRGNGSGGNGGNGNETKKTNPRRVPPGPNDPKEKMFGDKRLKWCGKCGIWTYHSTEEHKTKAELEAEKDKKSANASTNGGSYAGATALNF